MMDAKPVAFMDVDKIMMLDGGAIPDPFGLFGAIADAFKQGCGKAATNGDGKSMYVENAIHSGEGFRPSGTPMMAGGGEMGMA